MINKIKNTYLQYTPNEFLPIYMDGKVANMNEFHAYKFKKASLRIGRALAHRIDHVFTSVN